MMPQSWQADGGFRPDLLEAVAALKPPVIRWPGGCFASPYRWKDAIGPQEKRRVTRRPMWDDLDVDSLGTDEFIALCRKVGAEPLIVVNIGTPQWNSRRRHERLPAGCARLDRILQRPGRFEVGQGPHRQWAS